MTKDPTIPRRNKVNWHYVRDDHMFTTIKLVSRHQNTQQFGAILPVELTNKAIRNSAAYKEYYAIASGAEPPTTKTSVRKTSGADEGTSLIPRVPDVPTYEYDEEISWKSSDEDNDDDVQQSEHDEDIDDQNNDGDDFIHPKFSTHDKDEESFDPIVQTPSHVESSDDEGNDDASHGMNVRGDEGPDAEDDDNELYGDLNINLEGIDSIFESTPRVDVPVTTTVEPLLFTAPTLPPPSIHIISQVQQAPTPSPATTPSTSLQDLLNFELELKKILIEKMESNKSIYRSDQQNNLYKALVDAYECDKIILDTYGDTVTLKRVEMMRITMKNPPLDHTGASQHPDWFSQQAKPPTPDRAWNTTLPATHGRIQPWISDLAKQADSRTSFNELMDTPMDFSAFLMNRLKVDTLTPELLAGPTYELMKRSCKSLVELEFFLEEVYKAKIDQLDWNNTEVQQYPHDLFKPLPLIPNSQGRRVTPFDHFINNDLEYLHGGASSRKYTTSVTKTKASDYGHIKWIEDLVPRIMWSQVLVSYDKYALWGISHWGHKRQQFYGFVVNRESARDVYSKRRIVVVTVLQIKEWHNFKHLD
nr:hypothetical protein [Tanacetum cinerariifolium]